MKSELVLGDSMYERIVWRLFRAIMAKHGLTSMRVCLENGIGRASSSEVVYSTPATKAQP